MTLKTCRRHFFRPSSARGIILSRFLFAQSYIYSTEKDVEGGDDETAISVEGGVIKILSKFTALRSRGFIFFDAP